MMMAQSPRGDVDYVEGSLAGRTNLVGQFSKGIASPDWVNQLRRSEVSFSTASLRPGRADRQLAKGPGCGSERGQWSSRCPRSLAH